ncbi:MAG: putative Ig domain-containing protein, partial [Nitrospira sp.]
ATIGNLYPYDVEATTLTTPPLTYSFTQGPPANGTRGVMTIDSNTGVVSWTPAIPNPNTPLPYNTTVTVRATDALGRFTNQQFTIVVSSKPETIAVTQALFRNPPGPIGSPNSDASWTINGTSTVTAGSCTGTPNVCGTLTIYRVRLGVQAIIGTTTVQPDGTWFFAELPATPLAASGDTIRARSLTGGVSNDLLVTIQLN